MNYGILIDMAADVARLKTDMASAKGVVDRFASDVSSRLKTFDRALSGLGAGLSVAGIGTYFTTITKGAIEAGDRVSELSQITGISANTLSGWSVAAKTSGINLETLAQSMSKMAKGLTVNVEETKGAGQALAALGLNVEEFRALKPAEQMLELADSFSQVEDGGTKTAAAMAIFGKQGAAMIPFLNQGREGLEKFRQVAQDLGLVLDDETAGAMNAVQDGFEIMAMSSQGLGNQIAQKLLPTFEGLIQLFIESKREGGSLNVMLDGITVVFKGIVSAGMAAFDVLQAVGKAFGGIAAAVKLASEGNWSGAVQALKDTWTDVNKVLDDGNDRIRLLWEDSLPKLDEGLKKSVHAMNDFKEKEDSAAKAARELYASLMDQVSALERATVATEQQTEAEKLMLKVGEAIRDNKVRLTDVEKQQLYARLEYLNALGKQKKTEEELRRLSEESLKTETASYETIRRSIDQRKQENAMLGMTAEQQEWYVIGLQREILAKLEIKAMTPELSEAELNAIEAQIRAQKELIGVMEQGADLRRGVEQARQTADAWKQVAGDIQQALTNALVAGFENGKGFVQSIGDWIRNYFKTSVATAIAQAIAGALAAGFASAASASGGGGILSSLGGSAGGGGGGTGILSGLMGLGGAGSILGSGLGAGLIGTLGTFGIGSGVGTMGALSAAGSLMGTGTAGGLMAGGGMALGAVAPYLAAYGLYRVISGVGTGRTRGPAWQQWASQTGGGGVWNPYAGVTGNPALGGSGYFNPQLSAILGAVSAGASAFGGRANAGTGYGLYVSQGTEGSGALADARVLSAAGVPLFGMSNNGGNGDAYQRLMAAVPGMVLAGLQDSALPARIKEYFNSVSANGISQETLDSMMKTASAAHSMAESFKQLGGPFAQLADLSVEARAALAGLTGGIEAFTQKVGAYYSNFYSQEEQQAMSLLSAQRTLQAAGIDTSGLNSRAAFRSAVEGLDLTSAQGQQQFAAYMNAAGSFASGSDLLAATGMTLSQLTAGAPDYTTPLVAMNEQQSTTNDLLSVIADAIQNQKIEVSVRTSEPASVEVGWITGGGN